MQVFMHILDILFISLALHLPFFNATSQNILANMWMETRLTDLRNLWPFLQMLSVKKGYFSLALWKNTHIKEPNVMKSIELVVNEQLLQVTCSTKAVGGRWADACLMGMFNGSVFVHLMHLCFSRRPLQTQWSDCCWIVCVQTWRK